MQARELARVVRVAHVGRLAGERGEAGDGAEGLGDADLLDLLAGLEQGEQLLVPRVQGEDGDTLGVHQVEDLVLDVDEDVLDAGRRVHLVGDLDEALAVRQLALRGIDGYGAAAHRVRLLAKGERRTMAVRISRGRKTVKYAAGLCALLGACGGESPSAPPTPAPTVAPGMPPVTTVASEGWNHVPEGSTVNYVANPPASGPHYPVWGRYKE